MMTIMKIFKKNYQLYLDPTYLFDARIAPSSLMNQICPHKNKNQLSKFMKIINKPTKNGMKIVRALSVLHLLLIYSNQYYSVVAKLIPLQHKCQDQWLVKNVIQPYTHFLQKCCSSRELYCKTKELFNTQVSFERVFYLINLLFQLFKPVKKMSMLGRYYKDNNQVLAQSFVDVIAVQAQKIYGSFKNLLSEMLYVPSKYIDDKQKQELLKSILGQSLIEINQQMKKLFLDKYFYPYGKGIGIRLFRIEDQSESCTKIINGIMNDHQQTQRRQQQQQLQQNLFPQQGIFNSKFYEQSLMQTYIKNGKEDYFYQQAIDEDQQFDIPSPKNGKKHSNKDQSKTNKEGAINTNFNNSLYNNKQNKWDKFALNKKQKNPQQK